MSDSQHWHHETDDANIVWLCIDKADGSANVLSAPVLEQPTAARVQRCGIGVKEDAGRW